MTTAHKPTFHPAVGRADPGGYRYHVARAQYSSRDIAGHTKLKFRQIGQCSEEEIAERDLLAELEHRESLHQGSKDKQKRIDGFLEPPPPPPKEVEENQVFDDADDTDSSSGDDDDESSSEDEDEEEAELLRELENIKKERELERIRKEREQKEAADTEKEHEMLNANPLMRFSASESAPNFTVKRRWDEDVVFKNQAQDEPERKKRFVNDTIRNDFHVKFLQRYIK